MRVFIEKFPIPEILGRGKREGGEIERGRNKLKKKVMKTEKVK